LSHTSTKLLCDFASKPRLFLALPRLEGGGQALSKPAVPRIIVDAFVPNGENAIDSELERWAALDDFEWLTQGPEHGGAGDDQVGPAQDEGQRREVLNLERDAALASESL